MMSVSRLRSVSSAYGKSESRRLTSASSPSKNRPLEHLTECRVNGWKWQLMKRNWSQRKEWEPHAPWQPRIHYVAQGSLHWRFLVLITKSRFQETTDQSGMSKIQRDWGFDALILAKNQAFNPSSPCFYHRHNVQSWGFLQLYSINVNRPNNNADSDRGRSRGLSSPHGRRGAICAHMGWTYRYLTEGISWALVQKWWWMRHPMILNRAVKLKSSTWKRRTRMILWIMLIV